MSDWDEYRCFPKVISSDEAGYVSESPEVAFVLYLLLDACHQAVSGLTLSEKESAREWISEELTEETQTLCWYCQLINVCPTKIQRWMLKLINEPRKQITPGVVMQMFDEYQKNKKRKPKPNGITPKIVNLFPFIKGVTLPALPKGLQISLLLSEEKQKRPSDYCYAAR